MRYTPWGYFVIYVLPPIAWAGVILAFSSLRGDDLPLPPLIPHLDKVAHFCAYTILGSLILRAGRREWAQNKVWWWILPCLIIGCSFGAFDEWYQSFIPQRTSSIADWSVDCIGVAAGLSAWVWCSVRSLSLPMPSAKPIED